MLIDTTNLKKDLSENTYYRESYILAYMMYVYMHTREYLTCMGV